MLTYVREYEHMHTRIYIYTHVHKCMHMSCTFQVHALMNAHELVHAIVGAHRHFIFQVKTPRSHRHMHMREDVLCVCSHIRIESIRLYRFSQRRGVDFKLWAHK
jgi:hypothetical protein